MVMLERKGQYSAIADVLDEELVKLNKGQLPQIVDLIYKVMDGEDIDLAALPKNEQDYVKTAKVLMSQILYSHAWLD
jgi:5-methyltetrahydrofolate corrinoid/iron sulfur protein methyltransferase